MSTTTHDGAEPTIEFACGACGRLLKVPSSAAGRSAKCPQCGAVQAIPATRPAGAPAGPIGPIGPIAPTPNWGQPGPTLAPSPPMSPSAPMGSSHMAPPSFAPRPAFAPSPPPTPVAPVATPAFAPPTPAAPLAPPAPVPGRDTPTKRLFDDIAAEIGKIYVGQDELVLGALVALFSSGHVLIESVPGLGKTLFVRTLGRVLGLPFGRIQFTADLMPSDITGAPIFDMKTQEFRFRPGPVFTQLLLADEINRSPAKTHAALLETMQEYRVTIDGKSHSLDRPFLVLATQNPIESEGTYNLPEAQLDRFMFKLTMNYPRETEEKDILKLHSQQQDVSQELETKLKRITSADEIRRIIQENAAVRVDERLVDYIAKIVRLTRQWPLFHMGASPRAGIALMQASRTLAAFSGRDYAVPDDVVHLALPALRHRVVMTAEAEVEGHKVDQILTEMIRTVEVPRF